MIFNKKAIAMIICISISCSCFFSCTKNENTSKYTNEPRPTPYSTSQEKDTKETPPSSTEAPVVTAVVSTTETPDNSQMPSSTPDITPLETPTDTSFPSTEPYVQKETTPHPLYTPEVTDGSLSEIPSCYIHELKSLSNNLCISEVSSNNVSYILNGKVKDWVELYNGGDSSINLSSFYLSDDENNLKKSKLSNITVNSASYVVLQAETDFDFTLSSDSFVLYLSDANGSVIDSVFVCSLSEDYSMPIDGKVSKKSTPGYENIEDNYYKSIIRGNTLIINEVLSTNSEYIELYNNSNSIIDLSNFYLTDKRSKLTKFKLPSVSLKPNQYYVVSDMSFSISSSGETIYLTDGNNIIDALNVPKLYENQTYGLFTDGSYRIFSKITKGTINKNPIGEFYSLPVVSSKTPGEYNETIYVKLYSIDGGKIYYTVDGSEPTENSYLYDENTCIKICNSQSIRAINVVQGRITSLGQTFTYFINIPDFTLDIVSISLDYEDFDDIYLDYWNYEKEVKTNFAYFKDGKLQFSVDCGIAISGDSTREFDKKSFKLKFKTKYGYSKLKYKLFDDLDCDEFDAITLRSGGGAQASYKMFFNDEFCTSIVTDSDYITDVYSQHYVPVNLFINGDYFGIYFMKDKICEEFVAYNENVSEESVSIVESMQYVSDGTDQGFDKLWNYIVSHDLSVKEYYDYVKERICLESVSDYYIIQAWSANYDASNVRVCRSTENDGKWRFIYFDLDYSFYVNYATVKVAPYGIFAESNPVDVLLGGRRIGKRAGLSSLNLIFYELMKNSEFQTIFFERLDHLANNELSTANLTKRIDNLYNTIKHDMVYNINRWVGAECQKGEEHTYRSYEDWYEEYAYVKKAFINDEYLNSVVEAFKRKAAELLVN